MARTRREAMSQRQFVLEARAAIDFYLAAPSPDKYDRMTSLIRSHPNAMASSHVTRNIGQERLMFLRKEGLVE